MFDLTPAIDKVEQMITGLIEQLPNIIVAVVVFAAFYLLAGLLRTAGRRFARRAGLTKTAELVIGRLARSITLMIGLLVAAPILFPGFTAGQAVEVLGIGGVAIGFAFRDILQNFLAGLLLFLTQPFKIGDQIVVGDYEGTVEDIQTRATLIRTYDGRRVVIPNADLFTRSVVVNTAFPTRRTQYDVGIGYGDDIPRARQVILDAVASVDAVLKTPAPDAFVVELAPSSVVIRARWWTDSRRGEVVDLGARVVEAVKLALDEAGIDMPYPTRQVLFHDQTDETDGDRARQREGWPATLGEGAPAPRRIVDALAGLAGTKRG
jgi:small conductance mechanosensitive channel